MRLSELAKEYGDRKLLGEKTRKLYRVVVKHYSKLLLRPAEVADFTDANMARYASERLRRGIAAASVNGEQAKLYALWRYAARERYIEKWPTAQMVRVPDRIPVAWTKPELAKLFDCTKFAVRVGQVDGRQWWRALFYVIWTTGERIEAVLSIKWEWVDLDGQTIFMPAEVRKGKTRDRLLPISQEAADALRELPRVARVVFFWPYNQSTIWTRLKRMLRKGGLPCDRRSKFHRIRRSFASHLKANGGDATEALDQSSPKVTRLYIDPRIVPPTNPNTFLFNPEQPQ